MYNMIEYFGPVFVVKKLPTRMKTTFSEKKYATCGNKDCSEYGGDMLLGTYCYHCGSLCGSFDIETVRNVNLHDIDKELYNKLIYAFNHALSNNDSVDHIFIPRLSDNRSWITTITKQHLIYKSITRKCHTKNCDSEDYDIPFPRNYCSDCGRKPSIKVNDSYESNFSTQTCQNLTSLSDRENVNEFERRFDSQEADDNLEEFKQIKDVQDYLNVLNSIYGEGSTSIENRHINFSDNY
jgi:hypothetical protein